MFHSFIEPDYLRSPATASPSWRRSLPRYADRELEMILAEVPRRPRRRHERRRALLRLVRSFAT